MARRYGSSSGSRCFNSYVYQRPEMIANYVRTVVFLAVYIGILVTLCVVRKRVGAGKRLIGLAYFGALFFTVLQLAFNLIISTLSACQAFDDIQSAYDVNIASLVFSWLQTMLFLYVVFYLLNTMLRKQLGQNLSSLRIIFGVVLFILGILLLASTAILCRYYYETARNHFGIDYRTLMASTYISLAFDALAILSVLGSGILAILAVKSLKQKTVVTTSLMVWVTLVHFALLLSSVWSLAATAMSVAGYYRYDEAAYTAMGWITSIFYALGYVAIIMIAKNPVWRPTVSAEDAVHQQEAYYQEDSTRAYDALR